MEKDYVQILLDGITKVVEAKNNLIGTSELIEAIVIENYQSAQGKYRILYNGQRFSATASYTSTSGSYANQNYEIQDAVYVTATTDNTGGKSYVIIGKKVTPDTIPIKTGDPFADYVRFARENLQFANNTFECTFDKAKKADIISLAVDSTVATDKGKPKKFSFNFQITTATQRVYSYTLTQDDFLTSLDFTERFVRYNKLDVSNIGEIKKIKIETNTDNITIYDGFIELGKIINADMEDVVYIFSEDETDSYKTVGGVSSDNVKTVKLEYTYKIPGSTTYTSLTSTSGDVEDGVKNCEILWQKREIVSGAETWQNIATNNKSFSLQMTLPSTPNKVEVRAIISRINLSSQSVETLYSNILTFTNNIYTGDLIQGAKLELSDNSNGYYPYWAIDGKYNIEMESEFVKVRVASAVLQTYVTTSELFDNVEEVKWTYPDYLISTSDTTDDIIYTPPTNIIDDAVKEKWLKTALSFSYRIDKTKSVNITGENRNLSCFIKLKDGNNSVSLTRPLTFSPLFEDIEDNIFVRFIVNSKSVSAVSPEQEVSLEVSMYNTEGELMGSSAKSITLLKLSESTSSWEDGKYIPRLVALDSGKTIFYDIFKVVMSDGVKDYIKYQPVPLVAKVSDSVISYVGPTQITYDNTGKNPRFRNEVLKLYSDGTQLSGTWVIENDGGVYGEAYPTLDMTNNKIIPKNYYESNLDGQYKTCVIFTSDNITYYQPLVIKQSLYFSSLIDNWDGNYKVTEENIVLSSALVAGEKKLNEDNQNVFTGVIVGNIAKTKTETDGSKSTEYQSGLLGYQENIESFGFTADGKAFIGKSGQGRIELDGTSATIKSGNDPKREKINGVDTPYTTGGLIIDLDETYKDAAGEDIIGGGIHAKNFALMPNGDAYFKGHIDATSGQIGGVSITNVADKNDISKAGANLLVNSTNIQIATGQVQKFGETNVDGIEWQYLNTGNYYNHLESNTPITISFDLEMYINSTTIDAPLAGNGSQEVPCLWVYNSNKIGLKKIEWCRIDFSEAEIGQTIKQRCAVTTTIQDPTETDTINEQENYIEFYSGYGSGNTYRISNIKIEEGKIATAWSPCPLDEDLGRNLARDSAIRVYPYTNTDIALIRKDYHYNFITQDRLGSPHTGIEIGNEIFELGKTYVISCQFKINRLQEGGTTIDAIRGHASWFNFKKVIIDGKEIAVEEGHTTFANDGYALTTALSTHTLEFYVEYKDGQDGYPNFYLQPQRKEDGTYGIDCVFWDLQVELGDKKTPWRKPIADSKLSPNLLENSQKEVTKFEWEENNEFITFADLAPIFDSYGIVPYTISFDIKSQDTSKKSTIDVFCASSKPINKAEKYSIGSSTIDVSTNYERRYITVTPQLSGSSSKTAWLAFDGGDTTTNNAPSVKNVKVELGNVATPWSDAAQDRLQANVSTPNFSWKFSPTEGMYMWDGEQTGAESAVFKVWKNPDTNEHELAVKGHVEADSGTIGKWQLDDNLFYAHVSDETGAGIGFNLANLKSNENKIVMAIGNQLDISEGDTLNWEKCKFRVTSAGDIHAKELNLDSDYLYLLGSRDKKDERNQDEQSFPYGSGKMSAIELGGKANEINISNTAVIKYDLCAYYGEIDTNSITVGISDNYDSIDDCYWITYKYVQKWSLPKEVTTTEGDKSVIWIPQYWTDWEGQELNSSVKMPTSSSLENKLVYITKFTSGHSAYSKNPYGTMFKLSSISKTGTHYNYQEQLTLLGFGASGSKIYAKASPFNDNTMSLEIHLKFKYQCIDANGKPIDAIGDNGLKWSQKMLDDITNKTCYMVYVGIMGERKEKISIVNTAMVIDTNSNIYLPQLATISGGKKWYEDGADLVSILTNFENHIALLEGTITTLQQQVTTLQDYHK